jgi:hypothetical protein
MAWSLPAEACGISGIGAGAWIAAAHSLLIVFLMALVSLLSMRAAHRAVGRMWQRRPSAGLRAGHVAIMMGYGLSAATTIVSGGLLLALVLL